MTPHRSQPDDPSVAVRPLGRVIFQPVEDDPARFRTILPPHNTPGLLLQILFDGTLYPIQQHYVYARHRDKDSPYTFPNMEFHCSPPGMRVGPWPGWRRIPTFPIVTLSSGGTAVPVSVMPWGDELTTHFLRGEATFEPFPSGELICTTGDSRLRPIHADLYGCSVAKATPTPALLLPELRNAHPRLLLTQPDVPILRQKALGSHKLSWGRLISLMDNINLPWMITPESKVPRGPELLRGEDRALITALAALVDPSPSRCSAAKESLLAFIHETQQLDFEPLTIDTQAGETLFILSLCFDWTYDAWSNDERNELQSWLQKVADICWSYLGYQRRDYGQAHYLGCALGLLAFSFLFWEDHPRAQEWVAHFRGVLDVLTEMLPEDGFYPHGINLWIYEYSFLLRWLELFRVCTGADLWHSTDNWKNSSLFRAASTSPDGLYGITFGDPQFRVGGDSWCHFLIAARTRSTWAQSVGNLLLDGPPAGVDFRSIPPRRRVYELLYYDPDVLPGELDQPVQIFQDGGQIFLRNRDLNTCLFTFRAGPPLGRQRYAAGEHGGYGHADPANGDFLLYLGNRLALSGPGPTYRRETALHNTITIGGQGQVGDTTVWLPDFFPPEVLCPVAEFRVDGESASISATLTPAYLPHLGVEHCHRAMWVDPGRCIVGVDTVRCSRPSSIEWNIHASAISMLETDEKANAFDFACPGQFLRLVLLEPLDVHAETGLAEMVPAYPHDGTRISYLRLSVKGTEARFVWCFLLDESIRRPNSVSDNSKLTISFEGDLRLVYQNGFLTRKELYDNSSR